MKDVKFSDIIECSKQIREKYHLLEQQNHEDKWTVEEDALAFLTDAALVGRLVMSQQKRWPKEGNTYEELEHKLGESIWWLIVLADRMGIDIAEALDKFLSKTENLLQE